MHKPQSILNESVTLEQVMTLIKVQDQENHLDEETEQTIVKHLNLIDQDRYRQIVANLRKIEDIKVKYSQIHRDIAESGLETLKTY